MGALAAAVQTAMFSAAPADLDQLFAKSCTRTMQPDATVGCGKIMLTGEVLRGLLLKVDGAKDI